MKNLVYLLFAVIVLTACRTTQTAAEKEAKAMEIRTAIENFRFTFNASYAYPTRYPAIYLSSNYDVKVSPDTLTVYLPFYGRAYRAPISPDENGYRFTSTDFDYKIISEKKTGNHIIEIKINDQRRDLRFNFDIWENGAARLNVSDIDRQAISFQGEVSVGHNE